MRAFVITGPGRPQVRDVEPARARRRARWSSTSSGPACAAPTWSCSPATWSTCGPARPGTRSGSATSGAAWSARAGDEASAAWLGRRVTGDTMLGCGHCDRCRSGRQHLCEDRYEIGIRGGWPGALAEQLLVPASALLPLPDAVGATAGCAGRAGRQRPARGPGRAASTVEAGRREASTAQRLLVWAPARSACWLRCSRGPAAPRCTCWAPTTARCGSPARSASARSGYRGTLPRLPFDAVIDASTGVELPALAAELVEPGGGWLHRPVGRAQPARHPDPGAQGRHRRPAC